MTDEAKSKRNTFEDNLEQEGLLLSRQQHLETGLHFVKIYAPIEVLKRYAEILKLRLPMKKFEHIQEVQAIRSTIPIIGNVVKGVKNRFTEAFMYDQEKLPRNNHELTAVFSRDKGGFQLVDLIITELKNHMTCYKSSSHLLKLLHSDWRVNLVKDFFLINFPQIRAFKFISGHVIYNLSYAYKLQWKTSQAILK